MNRMQLIKVMQEFINDDCSGLKEDVVAENMVKAALNVYKTALEIKQKHSEWFVDCIQNGQIEIKEKMVEA